MRTPSGDIQQAARGITLLEIMIAVAVLGIITGLAVPSLRSAIQNSRAAAHSNEFIAALNLARSEAVKRRATVTICTSSDGATCRANGSTDANNWHKGWVVLWGATVLRAEQGLDTEFTLVGDTNRVDFSSSGSSVGSVVTPSFNLTASGCVGNNRRLITLGITGRVSVEKSSC